MMLTIFTPTHNRAALLPRLYASLLAQKNRDFEWLIIDDGSTDETENAVSQMMSEGKILITYRKKINGGKHTAHNEAIKLAAGKWFMCVDSDDVLEENAVAHIEKNLCRLCSSDCGFMGYKSSCDGMLLGKRIAPLSTDLHLGSYSWHAQGATGEYALVFRTEIIKAHPYPEIDGERFMGECVLYDRLELAGHTLGLVDEVLQICEYQGDGLSSAPYRLMVQNPTGYQIYHAQRLDLVSSWKERLAHAVRYQAFYIMSKDKTYRYRGKYRWLTTLLYLAGLLGAYYYRNKAESI